MKKGTREFTAIESPGTSLLLIERDFETRSVIKRFFEMSGYQVIAVSGEEEAAKLTSPQSRPDLILFNANLPPPDSMVSGYHIRQQLGLTNIPMIIISVHERSINLLNTPEADDFTIAYIAEVSRLDELENLVNCIRDFRK